MSSIPFSTDEIPIEVREKARHLWESIKGLVLFRPEDEQQVVVRIAACLMLHTFAEDMAEHIRKSPIHQRMIEEMKKRFDQAEGWEAEGWEAEGGEKGSS
jgi:hypothetical protein